MSDFWDREVIEKQHVNWMAIPEVRLYLNYRIAEGLPEGKPLWPIELFERFLQGRTFESGLSIGCGTGPLERELVRRGLCREIDAFDGSVVSLHEARKQADAMGYRDRIRYFAADFNHPVFKPQRYDIVMFHQSAHHVAKLERLYRAIMSTLKPGGIVYLDEYIGPSRHDWAKKPKLLAEHRRVFNSLPRELRAVDKLLPPIQFDDPSEAIRSSEIESQLSIGFNILGRLGYGGGMLSVIMPNIRMEKLTPSLLDQLIEEDRKATPFYALIAAAPKTGREATRAKIRYWTVPKVKMLLRAPWQFGWTLVRRVWNAVKYRLRRAGGAPRDPART
jgi:SAM-dependent methyltransferase